MYQKGNEPQPVPFCIIPPIVFDCGKPRSRVSCRPEGGRKFTRLDLGVLCDVNHFPDHIAADPAGVNSAKRIGIRQVNTKLVGRFLFETVQGITDRLAVGTVVSALVIAAHLY